MKHQLVFIALTLCTAIGASAQTPACHANVLGISDGRTNIQVEIPIGLNRWGQVIGTYGSREPHPGGLNRGVKYPSNP